MQLKKNKNVVKYRKPMNFNIGVIIFVIIFIYLVFNVFSYLTETHISVYEVEQGTIAVNNVYNGLILRDEKIINSDYSGAVNYYVKEGSKVAYGDLVCSVYQVYSFKDNVNASLSEALSVNALNDISDYVASAENNNTFHKVITDVPGIVTYYTDGFENVTVDNFTAAMFDESSYSKNDLKTNPAIQAGSPEYKLIDSEYWNIIVPVPDATAESLKDDDTIKIRFLKDAKEAYAAYSIVGRDGQQYLILSLKSAMVRYASERYVEIELLLSEETGLKIPNSAITGKEFYTVPISFFLKGGDSSDEGILVERTDKDGKSTTEFVTPTIYYETDDTYYIDSEYVSSGDILQKPDSSETYRVGADTASLQGVYNINKGYAVFKQIDVLYQNEEYTIVKTGTTYGIALYDHIALDGTKIDENQLIK